MPARNFDPKSILDNLPTLPGVYRMMDNSGSVLYVGKAINLKRRVSSYFQKSDLSPRIQLMVRQIASIETTVTRSESEALILENNLIKELRPRYNILFRDDKSYPYLMVSGHEWAQIAYFRGTLKKNNRYFGPFPNSSAVRESIQILQQVFRLRTCEDSVFANRSRPCLLHQIKRCSAPCLGKISQTDYQKDVNNAFAFLQGKTNSLIDEISGRMFNAAAKHDYEQAAQLRDQIQALSRIQEKQFVSSNAKLTDADVIAVIEMQNLVCINLVIVRGGRHLGDKSFFPQNAELSALNANLDAFLAQHYLGSIIPSVVVHNQTISQPLKQALIMQAGQKISFVAKPIAERREWLKMAEKNATLAIEQRLSGSLNQQKRLAMLKQILKLDNINRIECFDISHTFGEATVASCVVYDKNEMQPKEYRRYNITSSTVGDDYAAMHEVLSRRYNKMATSDGFKPDLILIDGGKGQVRQALEVLHEAGLNIPVVGVAKGVERKAGLETLIIPFRKEELHLAPSNPALLLIQTIRDESHRFAISGHRAKRGKARTTSSLESIAGIGTKRRQQLLTRFGGLRGVASASIEDLAQVDGISHKLAEQIYNALH